MDVKDKILDKIENALRESLGGAYIRLEDDDGISGFVVSAQFEGMSTLDRQKLIDDALGAASVSLAPEERHRVLMIAGLTPLEYDAVGASVRVQEVKQLRDGIIEVRLHGGWSDAEYVRGSLNGLKGVQTSEPKQLRAAAGVLMSFTAKGSGGEPLTRDRVIRVLKKQAHIALLPGA